MPEQNVPEKSHELTFTDNISIIYKSVNYRPDEAHLAVVNESNEAFLRAVAAIGQFYMDAAEETPGLSHELARLDLKLNLLLDLVSQLVYQDLKLPQVTRTTLSSHGISWESEEVLQPGEIVFVQAYVQHGTPKPLCFYGTVTTPEGNSGGVMCVEYLGLSSSVKDWLEKLIFRHHRRQIAFKKTINKPE